MQALHIKSSRLSCCLHHHQHHQKDPHVLPRSLQEKWPDKGLVTVPSIPNMTLQWNKEPCLVWHAGRWPVGRRPVGEQSGFHVNSCEMSCWATSAHSWQQRHHVNNVFYVSIWGIIVCCNLLKGTWSLRRVLGSWDLNTPRRPFGNCLLTPLERLAF